MKKIIFRKQEKSLTNLPSSLILVKCICSQLTSTVSHHSCEPPHTASNETILIKLFLLDMWIKHLLYYIVFHHSQFPLPNWTNKGILSFTRVPFWPTTKMRLLGFKIVFHVFFILVPLKPFLSVSLFLSLSFFFLSVFLLVFLWLYLCQLI